MVLAVAVLPVKESFNLTIKTHMKAYF